MEGGLKMEQEPKDKSLIYLEIDEYGAKVYATGLDSSIKLIAQQLLQGANGNSLIVLRNLLPRLIEINSTGLKLDAAIDKKDNPV